MAQEVVEKLKNILREYINKRGVGLALFNEGEEYGDMFNYRWAVSLALSSCIFWNPHKPSGRELAEYSFLDKDTSYVQINFCRTFVERRMHQAEHKLEVNHTDLFITEEEATKINSVEELIRALCFCNGREYEVITIEAAQLQLGKLIFAF